MTTASSFRSTVPGSGIVGERSVLASALVKSTSLIRARYAGHRNRRFNALRRSTIAASPFGPAKESVHVGGEFAVVLDQEAVRLLINAYGQPRQARASPIRRTPVLDFVTSVLAGRIGRCERLRSPRCCASSTAKRSDGIPSMKRFPPYAIGGDRRFRRVGHGTYQLACGSKLACQSTSGLYLIGLVGLADD